MNETMANIGLGSDLFDTTGRPMFGSAPLSLFSDAGLAWSMVVVKGGQLPPEAFTDYDALLIGGAKVSEAELKAESGRLRVIARNGVGFDAIDTEALSRRGILLTNTPIPVRHAVASIAVTFILTLSLRMPIKLRLAREGRWRERANYPGVGLPGRTLGIVGLGGLGASSLA
jgi:phosphoglycerate dehydrogenase-like enzyme